MYDIIKKYVENDNDNGLLLIDMPTGSGKTYSAIQFIYNSCLNANNKDRKYIFVTTLKKNLPIGDLEARFKENNQQQLYKEKVLLIDSNMESVVEGWSSEVESMIPYEIKKCDEYKRFKDDLEFVKRQRNENCSYELRSFVSSIETNLREKSEPRFRKIVSEYLSKDYKKVEEKIYAIKTDKKWQWVSKLYPAVFTRDRQVLFMSMDKFLSRNTTIVEPSYMFYNSDIIKNAVIFIDEFDATKDTLLKKIIDNGLHDKVNYIELFKDIHASLETDDFPVYLTTPSKQRMNGEYKNQSLESVITGIREKAEYLYSTYSLQFKHRTNGDIDDNYQNYLFQDHQFHAVLNGNNSYITMQSNENDKINAIGFSNKKPDNEKNNIQTMLGQLRGFIGFFQGAVNILAINYMQCKNERRKENEDVFSMEQSIRTILSLFRLDGYSVDYLTSQIMIASHKVKGEIEPAEYDLSFYERGFRYYAFENNAEHDMQSKIMMYSFQTTPEKTLLRFCEKAKVIGISATATVPSVIGNYDVDYLKNKMQKVYVEVMDDEKSKLEEAFNSYQAGYKDINIHTKLLGGGEEYSAESWMKVFDDKEVARYAYQKIQQQFGEGEEKDNYSKKRYLRIALAFKEFVVNDDIYSFLCVLNKHSKYGDKYLDRNILFELFEYIAKTNKWSSFYKKQMIVFLDGDEYEDKKNKLIERLGNGEKIFVISTYQTIGAGQNLQYPVPEFLEKSIVKTNNLELKNEKDFDAIYLDKPTYMIVRLTENLEEKDFVKYLFQMEYLQEVSEVSAYDAMINIKNAFKTFMQGKKFTGEYRYIYNKQSVVLMSTRYIIQAIGRICRTNKKNKNIYVYADEDIVDAIDVSVVNGRIYNPEFIALVEEVKKYKRKDIEKSSLEDNASLKSVRVNKEIKNMLKNEWTDAKVKKWKDLRELVLTKPTASEEEARSNFIIKNFYLRFPSPLKSYYYKQEEDYNSVSVSFVHNEENNKRASEEEAKLKDMMRIPGVKDMFEKFGYATSFEINDYMMTPTLCNNIYKGALGEVVGKYLFEQVLKVKVDEIDSLDLFELFDYKIADTSIYVDFKNWHEGMTEDRNKMLDKIARKANQCKCKCVVIANIYAEGNWKLSEVDKDGVHIVSVPYLIKDTDGKLSYDKTAWDVLRRCVSEYKN